MTSGRVARITGKQVPVRRLHSVQSLRAGSHPRFARVRNDKLLGGGRFIAALKALRHPKSAPSHTRIEILVDGECLHLS